MKDLILLVNPDAETERIVREQAGALRSVCVARCAADALALAAAEIGRLTLVILDLDRGLRGVPLLTALEIAHIPTVALTANSDPALHTLAAKHRAMDCLMKPVRADWLGRALDFLVPVPVATPLSLAA